MQAGADATAMLLLDTSFVIEYEDELANRKSVPSHAPSTGGGDQLLRETCTTT
jgi:hypothetical protein